MKVSEFMKRIWKGYGIDQVREIELPVFAAGPRVRRRIIFTGTVQHVGFRYETYLIAQRAGVTGWVRNCPDGSVEAEFQGEESRIQFIRQYLGSRRRICVENAVVTELEVKKEERLFEIIS